MRSLRIIAQTSFLILVGLSLAQSTAGQDASRTFAREKLIGAWHLVSMDEPGPGGKMRHVTNRTGMLVYTRDGHVSVQIMYPPSEATASNDYVLNGYEASFGSYDVDEVAHTVTHHVQASITHGLVGKDLTRACQFSGGRLIIRSTRPDEHWSVTWEHE